MTELTEIIRALSRPEVYPHPTGPRIELAQTQMSVVFLTGDYAYKVKKPVNLGYLDYTSLEKRHALCLKELELNRRLCPEIYLEVVPLVVRSGALALGGAGEVVEYAVKMRQLPADRMLDRLLAARQVTDEMVSALAEKLAGFHRRAETSKYINSFGELCTVMVNADENFSQTEKYVGRSLTRAQYDKIKGFTDSFIREHALLMHDRIDQARIRDCHGDLHAAHVCFTNGICIFDCIEFNDRFRYGDVASEVAFLAMDLDRHGRPDLSSQFVQAYIGASGDTTLAEVLPFFKCYRAYIRGKVESFKMDDAYLSESDRVRALENAGRYFKLAAAYAGRPALVIMAGLVGTGKTTVAEAIARRTGATVVSTDVVRKALAGVPATEHRLDGFESGMYSREFTRRTYHEAFREARRHLEQGRSVIVDATFLDPAERARARELAAEMSARFMAVECVLPEQVVRPRLEKRISEPSVSDGRWEVYVHQKATFTPLSELPDSEHVVVDTSAPWEKSVDEVIERLDP